MKKKKILEAGAKIFTQKGFQGTTIAEICQKAGTNIASVNYYFGSKEKLYAKVINYLFVEIKNRFPFNENLKEKSAEELLRDAIKTLVARIFDVDTKGNFYKIVSKEMAEPTGIVNVFKEYLIPEFKVFEKIIFHFTKEIKDKNLIKAFHFSIISQCMFPHFSEKGRKIYFDKEREKNKRFENIERLANYISDFCIAGIKEIVTKQGILKGKEI